MLAMFSGQMAKLPKSGEWMNWIFNEEQISSRTLDEADATLRQRLKEALGKA